MYVGMVADRDTLEHIQAINLINVMYVVKNPLLHTGISNL
jgi:hypothetical protein